MTRLTIFKANGDRFLEYKNPKEVKFADGKVSFLYRKDESSKTGSEIKTNLPYLYEMTDINM